MARNNFEGLMSSLRDALAPVVGKQPAEPPSIDVSARYGTSTPDSVFDASAELEDLTGLALSKLREIVQQPTDFDQLRMVQVQASASVAIINTQVKVDEGRLRRKKLDVLPKLLELIASEEGKLSQRTMIAATVIDAELA